MDNHSVHVRACTKTGLGTSSFSSMILISSSERLGWLEELFFNRVLGVLLDSRPQSSS